MEDEPIKTKKIEIHCTISSHTYPRLSLAGLLGPSEQRGLETIHSTPLSPKAKTKTVNNCGDRRRIGGEE